MATYGEFETEIRRRYKHYSGKEGLSREGLKALLAAGGYGLESKFANDLFENRVSSPRRGYSTTTTNFLSFSEFLDALSKIAEVEYPNEDTYAAFGSFLQKYVLSGKLNPMSPRSSEQPETDPNPGIASQELLDWLRGHRLIQYRSHLAELGVVDVEDLQELTDSDLVMVKVPLVPRRRLLALIQSDTRANDASPPSTAQHSGPSRSQSPSPVPAPSPTPSPTSSPSASRSELSHKRAAQMSPPQELEEPDSPESLPPTSSETATRSSSPTIRTRGFTRVEDGGLARSLAHGRDTDRSMPLELGKEDQNRRKPMSPVERAAREGSRIQKKSVRFSDDTDYYPSDTSEEDEAVTMNQPMWSAAGPSEPSFSSGNVWKEYQTADGRSYFFNELLGLSQWSVPEGSHILRRGPTGWVPLDHRAHSAQPQALPVQAQPTSSGSLPLERQSSDQFGHADNQEEVDSGAQYEVPGGAWDWMNEARDRERESPYERKILKFTPLKPQAFPNRGEPPDIEPEMQRDEPDLIRWRKAWEEVTGSTAQEVEQASRERSHDIQASLLAFSPRYSRRADQRAQKLLSNPTRVSHFDYAIKSRAKKPEKIPPPRSIYHSVSQYSFGTGARARTYEAFAGSLRSEMHAPEPFKYRHQSRQEHAQGYAARNSRTRSVSPRRPAASQTPGYRRPTQQTPTTTRRIPRSSSVERPRRPPFRF